MVSSRHRDAEYQKQTAPWFQCPGCVRCLSVSERDMALSSSPRRLLILFQNHRIMWSCENTLSLINLEFSDSFPHDFHVSFSIENTLFLRRKSLHENIQREGKSHFPFSLLEHNHSILTLTSQFWIYVVKHASRWFNYLLLISSQRSGGSLGGNLFIPKYFLLESWCRGSFVQGIIL